MTQSVHRMCNLRRTLHTDRQPCPSQARAILTCRPILRPGSCATTPACAGTSLPAWPWPKNTGTAQQQQGAPCWAQHAHPCHHLVRSPQALIELSASDSRHGFQNIKFPLVDDMHRSTTTVSCISTCIGLWLQDVRSKMTSSQFARCGDTFYKLNMLNTHGSKFTIVKGGVKSVPAQKSIMADWQINVQLNPLLEITLRCSRPCVIYKCIVSASVHLTYKTIVTCTVPDLWDFLKTCGKCKVFCKGTNISSDSSQSLWYACCQLSSDIARCTCFKNAEVIVHKNRLCVRRRIIKTV